jgi:hypothetical protein
MSLAIVDVDVAAGLADVVRLPAADVGPEPWWPLDDELGYAMIHTARLVGVGQDSRADC